MKKAIALLLLLSLYCTALVGCSISLKEPKGKREIPPPETTSEIGKDDSSETKSGTNELTKDTPDLDEGTIVSLDEIRQKAIEAGYEISELEDLQKEFAEGLVDGFNITRDGSSNLVMEFSTPDDAQVFADMVNDAGYNVAIVNGRFFTSVEATKGIITDLQTQKDLESMMDAKAQVKEQWSDTVNVSTNTTDYKSAFELMQNISKSMSTLMEQSLAKNSIEHPEGDPQNTDDVIPFMFGSIAMAFTSSFCENEALLEGIIPAAEMFGMTDIVVLRNAAHDYTLSARKPRNEQAYEINGVYDPSTGGLRMVEKTDGELTEFFEFIPLGDDRYAYQTDSERAIVHYKDGKLNSFLYTNSDSNDGKYDSNSDSIYPAGTAVDERWVINRGEDNYEQFFALEGKTIKLSVNAFGKRIRAEIPA